MFFAQAFGIVIILVIVLLLIARERPIVIG